MKGAINYIGALLLAAAGLVLSGCGASMYSSAGAAAYDDLYGTHDIRGLARRERQEAELQKALAEAREAQFRAEAAEYEARLRLNSDVLYERDGSDVLESTYEGAYARRLRGFEDEQYRPASGYQLGEIYRYDPQNYNLMVSGNQVWVEPKYITAFFGTWGADKVGVRRINSRYGNPYYYRDYWGYGWYPPYVGWDSYYVWNYPLGWGYPWWSDPFYYGYGWSYGSWGWHYPHYGHYHHWNTWPHGGGSSPGIWGPAHSQPKSYRDSYGSAPNRPGYSTPARPGSGSGSQSSSSRPGSYSSPSYRRSGSSTGTSSSSRSGSSTNTPSSASRSNASSGSSSSTAVSTGSSSSTSTNISSRSSSSSSSSDRSSGSSSSSYSSGGSSYSSGGSSYSGGSSSRSGGSSGGSRSR